MTSYSFSIRNFDRITGFTEFETESFLVPNLCDPVILSKMNLFENIPERAAEELFTELLAADSVRIERIVSFGQASPEDFWYDQNENEWVLLLEGSADVCLEGESSLVRLGPGDYLNIPAGCRHRVEKTAANGRTVWLAVFYK
jgi:cupin 2 domain-containing protein